MAKRFLLVVVLGVLSICSIGLAQEPPPETAEITLTTYYPAPYGDYKYLRVIGDKAADGTHGEDIIFEAEDGGDISGYGSDTDGGDIILLPGEGKGSTGKNGNVGIGTTQPGALLEVAGDNGNAPFEQIRLSNTHSPAVGETNGTNDINSYFMSTIGDTLRLATRIRAYKDGGWTAGVGWASHDAGLSFWTIDQIADSTATVSEKMRITPSGNVGIGTTDPGAPLEISRSSSSSTIGNLHLRNTVVTGVPAIRFYDATSNPANPWAVYCYDNSDFAIGVANINEPLRITRDGNVRMYTAGGIEETALSLIHNSSGPGAARDRIGKLEFRGFLAEGVGPYAQIAWHHNAYINYATDFSFSMMDTDNILRERVRFRNDGNVGIGTTSFPSGGGTPVMALGNAGSNPTGVPANVAGLVNKAGELYAFDSAGNVAILSPHDTETGEWIFYSKNTKTGRVVRVDMERLVKKVEELTDEKFMVETWEKVE